MSRLSGTAVTVAVALGGCAHLEKPGQELRQENLRTQCGAKAPFARVDARRDAVALQVVQRTPCQSSYDSIIEVEKSAVLNTPARVALAIAAGAATTGLATLIGIAIAPLNGDPRIARDVPFLMLVPGLGVAIFGYPLTGTPVARPSGTAVSPKVEENPQDEPAADGLLSTGSGVEVVLRGGKAQLALEELGAAGALPLKLDGRSVSVSPPDRARLGALGHCRAALAQPAERLAQQTPAALMALRREADACEDGGWDFTRVWLEGLREACAAQGIDCRR